MTFVDKDGQEIKVAVSKGDNLLDVAQAHDIEMEGTAVTHNACSEFGRITSNKIPRERLFFFVLARISVQTC